MSRWPLRKAYLWQEAPFLRLLVPLSAGIVCYDRWWPSPSLAVAAFVVLLFFGIVLVTTALFRNRNRLLNAALGCSLPLTMAALGWCAYAVSDPCSRPDWYGHRIDSTSLHLVRVLSEPRQTARTSRYTVGLICSIKEQHTTALSGQALLYRYQGASAPNISMGDTLLVPASWTPIHNNGNPFEFDNVAFQHRRGIHFLQYSPPEAIMVFGKANRKSSFLGGVHNWCNLQLRTYVHDTATLGLLQAMLLGDDSSFDPELRQAYAQTGVIHIVSISGSHVAVLFLVITGLLFWIKGSRGKWIKYGLAVALVWVYVLMAGAPPSALRSAIMFSVIALGVVTSNEGHSLNTLLAAAFALLLAEPAWLFSVGFQLSFGAVLSMLLFYSPIYRLWPQQSWIGKKIWQGVSASLSAEILTAPLVIYYFHNFPLLFIVANLLSALLIGLCALVGGLAIIAFCWIAPLARAIGAVVVSFVTVFNKAITWLQSMNPASFQYLQITVAELLTIYIIISAAALLLLSRRKGAVFTMLIASCVLLALLILDQFNTLRQERLIVYNNGRHPLVEVIRGHQFKTLYASNTAGRYAANAAHVGMHAWHKADLNMSSPCASINGKKVLVLSDTGTNVWNAQWPVDVLVLCQPIRSVMPDKILNTFHPRQLVLASNPGDYQLRKWEGSCRAAGVPLHAVSVSGAYILE